MNWSSLFCHDENERAWTLDMHHRLRSVTRLAAVVTLGAMLCAMPWLNLWSLVPMMLSALVFAVASPMVDSRRSIAPMLVALPLTQALTTTAIVINGRELRGDVMLLLGTVVAVCGGFPGRLVWAFSVYTGALMAVATLGLHAHAVRDDPMVLLLPLVMLWGVTMVATAVREASIAQHRSAILDTLTGMLNRTALANRVSELAQLSHRQGFGVGLVVLDLDHFKQVNDQHGHQRGDQVLQELAARLRKELRAFDLAYRIGGEEFVVLVPGGTARQSADVADRLLRAVRSEPLAGLPITASAGVAVSAPREAFEYDAVFARADSALYDAKQRGRDRFAVDGAPAAAA